LNTIDDPPEASSDSDADAARQLARALVINRVGGTVSWEGTLLKLGLEEHTVEGKAEQAKEWAREWKTVYADSVKRKRKKKMKKHK
jgi:fructosamine-3-kinase